MTESKIGSKIHTSSTFTSICKYKRLCHTALKYTRLSGSIKDNKGHCQKGKKTPKDIYSWPCHYFSSCILNVPYQIPCKGRIEIPKSSSNAKAAIKSNSSCSAGDRSSIRFKHSLARSITLSDRSADELKYSLAASKTSSVPLVHLIRGPRTGLAGTG